jgi:hypothetical protein
MSESMRRSLGSWLIVLSVTLITGVVILGSTVLPLATCFVCDGTGRYIWKSAEMSLVVPYFKLGDAEQKEVWERRPAVSSACGLCSSSGRLTYLRKWKAKSEKPLRLEPVDLRDEGRRVYFDSKGESMGSMR